MSSETKRRRCFPLLVDIPYLWNSFLKNVITVIKGQQSRGELIYLFKPTLKRLNPFKLYLITLFSGNDLTFFFASSLVFLIRFSICVRHWDRIKKSSHRMRTTRCPAAYLKPHIKKFQKHMRRTTKITTYLLNYSTREALFRRHI